MRNFIDIVSGSPQKSNLIQSLDKTILLEGKQYLDMFKWFDGLLAQYPHLVVSGRSSLSAIIESIKALCSDLRRIDRQMWAARICRLWLISQVAGCDKEAVARGEMTQADRGDTFAQFQAVTGKAFTKYMSEYARVLGHAPDTSDLMVSNPVQRIRQEWLRHYAGIEYSKIQSYVFDEKKSMQETWNDLHALEEEYKEKISGMIVNEPGDQIIKKFGNGYVWVLLTRGYCRKEADAMGHCGNSGAKSDDRIISLRKFNETVDGVDYYNACLTFILNGDGRLGEMKGRANEKPAARYHEMIIELLKMPLIKGIRGGGYMPGNNFSLSDLTDEQRDALIEAKPELGGFELRFKKLGDTKELRHDILDIVKEFSATRDAKFEEGVLVCKEYPDIRSLAQDLTGDEPTERLLDDDPFEHWHFDSSHIGESEVEDFINSLPLQYQIKLGLHAQSLVEAEGDEEEIEEFDMTQASEVAEKLKEYDESTFDQITWSISDGERMGAEAEAWDATESAITSAIKSIKHGTIIAKTYTREPRNDFERRHGTTEGYVWDTPVKIVLSIEDACKLIDLKQPSGDEYEYDNEDSVAFLFWDTSSHEDDVIHIDEPSYGWSGYDNDAAIERFLDQVEIDDFDAVKPDGPEPDFANMEPDALKAWITEMYAKIPDGFIRKIHPEALDQQKLADAAKGLWTRYYRLT